MREAFVGIDVAFAKKKRLPICLCVRHGDGGLEVKELTRGNLPEPPRGAGNAESIKPDVLNRFAEETVAYLHALETHFQVHIARIGIDAPSAPCRNDSGRRRAEVAMDKQNISCFATPSMKGFEVIALKVQSHLGQGGRHSHIPHANQLWMLVGFALFNRLTREGWECLEVYPQATMRVLEVATERKTKPGVVAKQMERICSVGGWSESRRLSALVTLKAAVYGAPHDRLDAYASAWVASLPEAERHAFGEPPTDAIWVPRMANGVC